MDSVSFELNGKQIRAEHCANHTTLLDFIRQQGLTGTKEGCAEGECGACTVLFVQPHGEGSKFVPVNSCLVLLPMAAGQEVYTVEALADGGRLAEVQKAMVEQGGSQCGYCTPGFVVSMFAEQYRPERLGACDPHNLGGNLCRCTGYRPIRDALAQMGVASDARFLGRMARPAPVVDPIQVRGFSRPESLGDCLDLFLFDSSAKLVAGGTDLGVDSNLKGLRFEHLVSIEALPELRAFSDTASEVVVGAALPLSEIGLLWRDAPPIFREWLPLFASPLIRNRATLGGNLATASPIGDAAPMLMALDAGVKISSKYGDMVVPITEFFTGYRKTQLEYGELIESIHIPKPFPRLARFFKVAKRRMDDISSVAAGFAIHEDGTARLAFGGMAATPLRAVDAERELMGSRALAKQAIAGALRPISDHRASAEYRLAVGQSLIDKFWHEAGL